MLERMSSNRNIALALVAMVMSFHASGRAGDEECGALDDLVESPFFSVDGDGDGGQLPSLDESSISVELIEPPSSDGHGCGATPKCHVQYGAVRVSFVAPPGAEELGLGYQVRAFGDAAAFGAFENDDQGKYANLRAHDGEIVFRVVAERVDGETAITIATVDSNGNLGQATGQLRLRG